MTPKVLSYWTNDFKMTSNVLLLVSRKTKISFLKRFWINNKATIEFSFRTIWRILQISECVIHLGFCLGADTLFDLQNSSYPTQPHSIIAKYYIIGGNPSWSSSLPQSHLANILVVKNGKLTLKLPGQDYLEKKKVKLMNSTRFPRDVFGMGNN